MGAVPPGITAGGGEVANCGIARITRITELRSRIVAPGCIKSCEAVKDHPAKELPQLLQPCIDWFNTDVATDETFAATVEKRCVCLRVEFDELME